MSWFSWLKPKPKFKPTTVEELVQHFNGDIITISQWIEWNIWYYKDTQPSHNWQRAQFTLERMKGDCEDFAVLYAKMFQILGWEHRLYCGYPTRGTGHAICVVQSPKGMCYTSNDLFRKSYKEGWEEVVREAMPSMAIYRRADVLGLTMESFH
jgi:hypothetical protein